MYEKATAVTVTTKQQQLIKLQTDNFICHFLTCQTADNKKNKLVCSCRFFLKKYLKYYKYQIEMFSTISPVLQNSVFLVEAFGVVKNNIQEFKLDSSLKFLLKIPVVPVLVRLWWT